MRFTYRRIEAMGREMEEGERICLDKYFKCFQLVSCYLSVTTPLVKAQHIVAVKAFGKDRT
jgi:hypothetical protein